ncbi:MAG: S1C family serine protease [Anaeromyxobacteraceae bacterium]
MNTNPDPLAALSSRVAEVVAARSAHVLRVDGRRRAPASGVAWREDLVLTTHHALERDEEVELGLPDGSTAAAEVAGRDPTTDLALLRVAGAGLTPAPFADAAGLGAGHLVLAVTRPGKSPRADLGVLARAAGEWRGPAGGKLDRWLETSLPLHPGLSGGLALSAAGEPVGLLTAGLARGVAMILPAETLRRVAGALAEHGGVRRGYLGVSTYPVRLPPPVATAANQYGALLVSAVEPGSPAAQAGLLLGDALLTLGGEEVADLGDLLPLLEAERIGTTLRVKLLRAGEVRELDVTVGARERRSA